MKTLIYISFLIFPAVCQADTFQLKDGAKIEGEITGEMDGVLMLKTRYGTLTVNRSDIAQQTSAAPAAPAAPEAAPAPAAVETSTPLASPALDAPALSTQAPAALPAAPVSTEPAVMAEQPELPAPGFSFKTIVPSTSARLLVYMEDGVVIATETYDAAGGAPALEGALKDGTYTEYYPGGELKTVKTVSGGKTSGSLKTFYLSGSVQIEASYLAGAKEGPFKYFSEDGKPLLEAVYKNDKLNGLKKEFGPDGAVRSEVYYENDRPTELPKLADSEPAHEQDTMLTARVLKLARGERYTFELNGKYLGKVILDKDHNVTSQEGKVPDGSVKIYSGEGKLQKEMLFQKNELKILRLYEDGGPLKATYTYTDGKASAFAQK